MHMRQPDDPGVRLPPKTPPASLEEVRAQMAKLFALVQFCTFLTTGMLGALAAFIAFYRANMPGCWLLCLIAFALPFAAAAQI